MITWSVTMCGQIARRLRRLVVVVATPRSLGRCRSVLDINLEYLRHSSPILDVKILAQAVLQLIRSNKVY
jgi:lipopolysaccharide/colanic/teichoic acid biosynthesis glycosyltransferase